ncbi:MULTISPECIES: sigma-70 family RNA polymerase sigma factor [unclassified Dolichospermum]|uniref:sigma-70 family RNA polymerase sigma factor n=1 Tax=unclassified Dolichospermum TaxID=2622029 RepID=UPI0014462242|nr:MULTISPECIES: sigma-70 family RNA polymerase sigma factor [unclassified Dolichospermum]MTJ19446.1 sigma-70 family RNA polymerase sigma factor [Dolichospermum sp. UHCC 0299]MTJ21470.1 sigma-70 family RNA polymerase sigma factor [Dolichospermum sp. UHCC 0352]MTJ40608.1 sigma-70 family RNA polymerase sigma factor [Dolichospermum sp. UHCC 0406]
MDELEVKILQLIQETCQHPSGSLARQKGLNQIILLIQKTGKLLRGTGIPDAEEALQETWWFFCRNLCEATSAKEPYNPDKSSVITWINNYFSYRLQDKRISYYEQKSKFDFFLEENDQIDPASLIPAPTEPRPILNEIQEWLKTNSPELKRIHIRNRPDVNSYILITRRLPPEKSWLDLSVEFGIPVATLSNFYQRQCFPRLLNFGKSQAYFDSEGYFDI